MAALPVLGVDYVAGAMALRATPGGESPRPCSIRSAARVRRHGRQPTGALPDYGVAIYPRTRAVVTATGPSIAAMPLN